MSRIARTLWEDVREAASETPRMYFSTVTQAADLIGSAYRKMIKRDARTGAFLAQPNALDRAPVGRVYEKIKIVSGGAHIGNVASSLRHGREARLKKTAKSG